MNGRKSGETRQRGASVKATMKHRTAFQAFQLALWHAPRHMLRLQHHVHITLA